jgi:glycosidase
MIHRTTRLLALAAVLLVGILLAGTVAADHTPDPASVTIAGSLQSELGCPGDWQPECANTHIAFDAADDVWQGTFNLAAGAYEYKAALNDSWTENYGANAQSNGPNIPLNAPGGDVKFYYDHKSHWITDNNNSRIATAAGDFQSELGCPGDWQPECLRSWLQDPDGDGTYSFVTEDIPAGNYETKAAMNEGWNESYPPNNKAFSVPNECSTTTFTFVSATNAYDVASVAGDCDPGHGHDNNVEYFGLGHNSHDDLYRVPFGAVMPGTEVILRFRTYHNDVESVRARVWDDAAGGQFFLDLQPVATDVSCYDAAQPDETCDFWQASLTPAQPTTYYYRFIVTDGTATANYEDDAFRDGGWGEAHPDLKDWGWAIQVYDAGFEAVDWLQNAVMYQIFPDRFRNGRSNNDANVNAPRYGWPDNPLDRIIRKAWTDLPEGYCRFYVNPATPCTESPRGRDYFGGDIMGVNQRLNYLRSLGVTAIYFNPVFDAASNHAYDTQDYYKIDPFFGTNKEFDQFLKAAEKAGIKVILDGVFNHVSSDSKYFDRYHHFADVGACESVDSPYRQWFTFFEEAGGPCAGPNGPNTMNYPAWFGFDSLPVLNKNNPDVQALIYSQNNSVGRYWLNRGADGWRLDVMGDGSFPADFWPEFREAIKATNPNAPIIGELWKKFEILPKVRGDQADTAMGYRFRNAILGFFGRVDDKGFVDDGQTDQPPSLFAKKLISIREDNPDASYYTMMNILGSHDTQRILWLLTPGERNREEREFNTANLARGKQLLELAAVVQMTTPGAPTIYYGDEVAMTGDDDPDDRRTFPWDGVGPFGSGGDGAMLAHYSFLTDLRRDNAVFRQGELTFLLTDDTNRTLAYLMRTGDAAAVVAVNRNDSSQTLVIDAEGMLPDAAALTDALGAVPGTVTAANGTITVELPGLSAAVLLPTAGQDLVAPDAPAGLVAVAGNGQTTLDWNGVGGAAAYRVYRSPVTGGGYVLVAETTSTDYVDSGLENGREYFYVVTAVDAAGNEGAYSNEAAATPFFPIGYTVLQWPPTLNHTISVNGTDTVYGRVYVAGVTDAAGDPALILAEVGFGPDGSDPATWTNWWPMSRNAGCGDCGNNYEYMGNMTPEQLGEFDYLVRFSTDNGHNWVYGDVDGWFPDPGQSPTNDPGDMTVASSGDTTPPADPANLTVTGQSPVGIALAWDAVADADLAFYEVLRGDAAGGPYVEIGETNATTFNDTAVMENATYYYVVRAVDTSFNRSGFSNEVSGKALPRTVTVTFNVDVPPHTPAGKIAYITGTLSRFDGGHPDWNSSSNPMTPVDADTFAITFTGLEGTQIEYKYTLGGPDFFDVEKGLACEELGNRMITLDYGATGAITRNDTVVNWRNVAPCGN